MSNDLLPSEQSEDSTESVFDFKDELNKLGPEYNQNPNLTKHDSFESLVKSHLHQNAMVGRDKIALPNAEDPVDISRALGELGRPDSPADYEPIAIDDAEQIGWDGDFESRINQALFDSGLTQQMHANAIPKLIGVLREEELTMHDAGELHAQNTISGLKKKYGLEYDARLELGNRAAREFFGENWEEFAMQQFRDGTRPSNHPGMMEFLIKVGEHYVSDDSDAPGRGPRTARGLDVATAQSQIRQKESDPEFRKKYLDAKHPQHAEALGEMDTLYAYAYPEK